MAAAALTPPARAYAGWVLLMDSQRDKALRFEGFNAVFDGSRRPVSVDVNVPNCGS